MNNIKITINDLGPIHEAEYEINKITIIKTDEISAFIAKKFIKILLSTLAYGPYHFQHRIGDSIKDAKREMEYKNKCLAESLYALSKILIYGKDAIKPSLIQNIHRMARDILFDYLYEAQEDPKDLPSVSRLIDMNITDIMHCMLKNYHDSFNRHFRYEFEDRKEFKSIFESDDDLAKMLRERKCWRDYESMIKCFNDSKIELSGTLFDKKIESEFEIKDGKCKISINDEFNDVFNPNEIIAIENKKSRYYRLGIKPSSIMDQIYHSNSYSCCSDYSSKSLEKRIKEEHYPFHDIMGGIFFHEDGEYVFKSIEDDEDIFKNHPSGMNAFAKLQLLFRNEFLIKDSVLILDNIEDYLIPEWQEKLAELIAAMSKELDISVIVFSDNDFFIGSIMENAADYGLEEESSFYRDVDLLSLYRAYVKCFMESEEEDESSIKSRP